MLYGLHARGNGEESSSPGIFLVIRRASCCGVCRIYNAAAAAARALNLMPRVWLGDGIFGGMLECGIRELGLIGQCIFGWIDYSWGWVRWDVAEFFDGSRRILRVNMHCDGVDELDCLRIDAFSRIICMPDAILIFLDSARDEFQLIMVPSGLMSIIHPKQASW